MYTAHTNPSTCAIESDYLPLHHLTNCNPGDPSTLMTVLQTEGYTDIKYIGGGYFTFNSLTAPTVSTVIVYDVKRNTAHVKDYDESGTLLRNEVRQIT